MKWHEYFINLLGPISSKSKDPRTKVGAICVDKDNRILATGFNGFPKGVNDLKERYEDREVKYKFIVHAEQNILNMASKNGISLNESKIFIPWYPCSSCTKNLIQSGIKEIVIDFRDSGSKLKHWKKWEQDIEISKIMLNEAGVKITLYLGE